MTPNPLDFVHCVLLDCLLPLLCTNGITADPQLIHARVYSGHITMKPCVGFHDLAKCLTFAEALQGYRGEYMDRGRQKPYRAIEENIWTGAASSLWLYMCTNDYNREIQVLLKSLGL